MRAVEESGVFTYPAVTGDSRDGTECRLVMLDITERKEAEEILRRMKHQMLLAQEEERKELSHELHDEIAQLLAGINVQLAALMEVASSHPRDLPDPIARTLLLVKPSVDVLHHYARQSVGPGTLPGRFQRVVSLSCSGSAAPGSNPDQPRALTSIPFSASGGSMPHGG